jgi:3',5'-cyclic-AMP phosphodiesterase
MTDMHMMPENRGEAGVIAAVQHVNAMQDRADLIVTGGDSHHLGMSRTREQMMWMSERLRSAWSAENSIPVEHTLGNHDVWGWTRSRSQVRGDELEYGKAWAADTLGIRAPYRVIDRAGWRIVILDSIQSFQDAYMLRLDPFEGEQTQFDWLARTLEMTPINTPVCIVSHGPILGAGLLMSDANVELGDRPSIALGPASMHLDAHRLIELFERVPRVRLCLSGHIHVRDVISYNGVTYVCSGAVSGSWWRTREADRSRRAGREPNGLPRIGRAEAGYEVVDLFNDGTFATGYQLLGWQGEAG